MARVTAISLATGQVIRRAATRPVTSAGRAASPAAPAMARSSVACSLRSVALRPAPGEPGHGLPDPLPADDHCGTGRRARLRGEARRGRDGRPTWSRTWTAAPVRWAKSRTGDRLAAGGLAVVPVPGCPGGERGRTCQLGALLAGQGRDVRSGEGGGQPGQQRDGRQRDRQECQRQPQPERITTGAVRARPASLLIASQAEPVSAAQHGLHDLRI
jgi:hypothetical protein